MNKNIKEIQDNLQNFEQFTNWVTSEYTKTIDSLSRGELREALSYYPWLLDSYDLPTTNIINEAILQKTLRLQGYDIPLMDVLPQDLTLYLNKLPWQKQVKNLVYDTIKNLRGILFVHTYLLLILIGLVYFHNWELLLISLMITYVSWMFLEIAKHDYIEHRNIVPKNIWLKYIIDFILYITSYAIYKNKPEQIKSHLDHHKYWRTDKDLFSYFVGTAIVRAGSKLFNPLQKPSAENMQKLLAEYKTFPWLFKYLREIEIVFSLIFITTAGIELFFYIFMLPLILKPFLEAQHDWYIITFGERNYWFLYPISWNQSWHVDHHIKFGAKITSWDDIFYGPKWLRYTNPQYYFARLFFKLN
jgi:hypothetical protein